GRAPDWRRLGIVALIGVLLAVGALGVASLLDDPVGESAPDAARPAVGGSVAGLAPTTTTAPDPSNAELPPFATVLERPLPDGLSEVPAEQAIAPLSRRVAAQRSARRLVELAVGYQRVGRPDSAEPLFREALRLSPGYLPARVGLAMVPGGRDDAGLTQSQSTLTALRREYPRSQMVVFNQAWAALYRRDGEVAFPALRATVRLGPDSFLGAVAASLLAAAKGQGAASGP
ncbi:MAG: hypothetical protein AB1416_13335, partial [Actinomycetota bacterium]